MPTNLPQEYYEIEKEYRAASLPTAKISLLEEMLSVIPKHKGTDKLRADLRRRLSKLKESAQARKGAGGRDSAFLIDREGAGQVVVVGVPNVGKSALVATLTNAEPEVADYPLTTWKPTPGMMPVYDTQIQLIDTPPLTGDYIEPALVELIKRADLMLLVVDLLADPVQQLEDTVALLEERRIAPLHFRDRYAGQRQPTFVPTLVLANKCDDQSMDEDCEIFRQLLEEDWPLLPISATTGRNLEELKQVLYKRLGIIRVYSKPPGKEPDYSAPFVLKQGDTIADLAAKVHKDFVENLKSARVWGPDVHDGQMVGRDHVLRDGDVVELQA